MKKGKTLAILAIAISLVCAFTAGTRAADTLKEISAYLNYGITVKYNGDAQVLRGSDGSTVYPITYNGTTYLPVRAIANILGIAVDWDQDTQTVLLGNTNGSGGITDIGAEGAKSVALNHAGLSENQVTNLWTKQDYDDGRLEYDVDFVYNNAKYEYTIDGTTGVVIGYELEPTQHGQTPSGNTSTATDIGADAAKVAALNHAGLSESQVSRLKAERDWDDGHLEYEVEFKFNGYEYEYTIHGATGAILEYERDWDD